MEQGDVVKKASGNDKGKMGLVLDYFINSAGNDFISVMLPTGQIKTWYARLVVVIHTKCISNDYKNEKPTVEG